jgi:hypothetical protein
MLVTAIAHLGETKIDVDVAPPVKRLGHHGFLLSSAHRVNIARLSIHGPPPVGRPQ